MIYPTHNDAYSIFTDEELVCYVNTFDRERIGSPEELAHILNNMVTALAGRLEKRFDYFSEAE